MERIFGVPGEILILFLALGVQAWYEALKFSFHQFIPELNEVWSIAFAYSVAIVLVIGLFKLVGIFKPKQIQHQKQKRQDSLRAYGF